MYVSPKIVGWGVSNNDDCKNGWVITHNNLLLARMKTSCFYLYSGEGRIGVARTSPKHVLDGLKYYPALAPGKWLFDAAYKDYATYRERYFRDGKAIHQLRFEELAVRPIGPDAALATARWTLEGGDQPGQTGWFTLVLQRIGAGWRAVHDHSS